MISGIFGLPGSGKSLYLSMLADRAVHGKNLNFSNQTYSMFKSYDKVYTNFPFPGAYQLDFDLLGKVEMRKCLILCDEIMNFCDSRNFKTFGDNLKFFFSQHRKMEIDFLYASQAYNDCDLKIRNLTHSFYYIQKGLGTYSVVKPIKAFFKVTDGQIKQGYEYSSPFDYYYFNRARYYNLVDTNYLISKYELQAYTPLSWFGDVDHNALEELNEKKTSKLLQFGKKVKS